MTVTIEVGINIGQFQKSTNLAQKEIIRRLVSATDKILDLIEATQIKKYTSAGEPDRPTGSKYERTFTLRDSSKKKITSRRLPEVEGLWWSEMHEAPYNKYVIGPRSEQAPVHRDRWKSIEEVVIEVDARASQIIREELNEGRI